MHLLLLVMLNKVENYHSEPCDGSYVPKNSGDTYADVGPKTVFDGVDPNITTVIFEMLQKDGRQLRKLVFDLYER